MQLRPLYVLALTILLQNITSKARHGCQMAMPIDMVAKYDMISPDVHISTCTTIYHNSIYTICQQVWQEYMFVAICVTSFCYDLQVKINLVKTLDLTLRV